MSRFAILISSPGAGADALTGPAIDIANVRSFLASPIGGGWVVPDEVRSLTHPTVAQVTDLIAEANERDYCFLAYSGHGARVGNNTQMSLSVGQSLTVEELAAEIDTRATVVIDTCRVPPHPPHPGLQLPEWEQLLAEGVAHINAYRAFFEGECLKAPEAITTIYACRDGETARDTPNGAVFLNCLINEAMLWAEGQHYMKPRGLTTAEAMFLAARAMGMMGIDQHPSIRPMWDYRPKPPLAVWLPQQ